MSLRTTSFRRLALAFALSAGWAISLTAADTSPTTNQPAMTSSVRDYSFPPVTLATSETARLIVINTAAAPVAVPVTTSSSSTGSNSTVPAPSCTGTLAFTTYNGAPSATTSAAQSSATTTTPVDFTIGAGQVATLDLLSSHISTSPGEVVGLVTLTSSNALPRPACSLAMSMEVFDSTSGVGHVVLTNAAVTGGEITTILPNLGDFGVGLGGGSGNGR
jgi:hypothetical protein